MELKDTEFAVILLKDKEGNVKVMPFPDKEDIPAPPSIDDVYNACNSIIRNITIQQNAQAVHMAIGAALQQAQQTESGLVVPGGPLRK